MHRLSSRKFILAILALASASGLCWANHIADGVYSTQDRHDVTSAAPVVQVVPTVITPITPTVPIVITPVFPPVAPPTVAR